jgi:hypothetical protein
MGVGGCASLKSKNDTESIDELPVNTFSKRTLKEIIITDVSRMEHGHVCVFGIDSESNHIRPVIPIQGLSSESLKDRNGNLVVKPLAIVEFDFIRPNPEIPHVEDFIINPCYKPVLIRELDDEEGIFFFKHIVDRDIKSIFGTDIVENRFTQKNTGKRSIGTILVHQVHEIIFKRTYSKQHFSIHFSDSSGKEYLRPITDCAFQKFYLNSIKKGINAKTLNQKLKLYFNQNTTYLRVGLGRYFNGGHWLIVTGLYTFPDYKSNLGL